MSGFLSGVHTVENSPEHVLLKNAQEHDGLLVGQVSQLLARFGHSELTRESRREITRKLSSVGLDANPHLRMPWVKATSKVKVIQRPGRVEHDPVLRLAGGEPIHSWLLPGGGREPLLLLEDPPRIRTAVGERLITADTRADVDTAGDIAATRGRNLAAKAIGGLLVPGGAFVFGNARDRVIDARELYLILEAPDWSFVEQCDPAIGQIVREFAQAINTEARRHAASAAAAAQRPTKQCPDCAEIVLADANVCKHCRYRFSAPGVESPS